MALGYPVLGLGALAFALITLWHQPPGSRRRITAILLAAVAVLAGVTTYYAGSLLTHTYEAGDTLDVFWIITFALVIWAAAEEEWGTEPHPHRVLDHVLAPDLLVAPIAVAGLVLAVVGGRAKGR